MTHKAPIRRGPYYKEPESAFRYDQSRPPGVFPSVLLCSPLGTKNLSFFLPCFTSSYEVAVFDIYFDQPVYYRGLSLVDVGHFVSQHHLNHRVLDHVVQLQCAAAGEAEAAAASASAASNSGVLTFGSAPNGKLAVGLCGFIDLRGNPACQGFVRPLHFPSRVARFIRPR